MENSSINVNFEPVENEKDQEAVIEAVLFTIGGAVELRQLAAAIGQDKETAKRAVERLAKRYREETRGMEIKQLEDSYQMCTRSEYYENLIRVAAAPKKQVLSDVVLETLSIIAYRQPVTKVIAVKLGNSLFLMGLAWVVSGLVGFLLGVLAGVFQGRLPDKIIKGYSLVIASTPSFWLALLLLIIFGVWMKILPIGLSVPIGVEVSGVTFLDRVRHAILPAVTLSITGISNITLHTREKMIDIMESDYILFAKARGEKTGSIIFHHGIRNVLLPAMTLQFASVSEIIGGSVLVEQVFSYPGLGQAAVAAGTGSDVPLLMGITLITAAIVFLGNFLANVLYGVVDPRIRKGGLGL